VIWKSRGIIAIGVFLNVVVIAMECNPFTSALHYLRTGAEFISVLDDVNILYA